MRVKRDERQEKALVVTEELGQMEIWSSGSDDKEATKPTHGCFMEKTMSPTQTKLDEVLSILKSLNIKSDKCENLINSLEYECQET